MCAQISWPRKAFFGPTPQFFGAVKSPLTPLLLCMPYTCSVSLFVCLFVCLFCCCVKESERARAIDTENSLDDRLHIMQITITDLEGK